MNHRRALTGVKSSTPGALSFTSGLILVGVALALTFWMLRPTPAEVQVAASPDVEEPRAAGTRERLRSVATEDGAGDDATKDISAQPSEDELAGKSPDGAVQEPASEPFEDDMKRAIALIDASKPDEAAVVLEAILQKDPRHEQALIELAMVHLLDFRRYDVATGLLERALDVNPKNRVIMAELVSLYEEQGQPENGIVWFTDFAAKNSDVPDAAWGLGQILSSQGRDSEAVAWLEKASATQNERERVLGDLADAYSRTGQGEKAVAAYRQAIDVLKQQSTDKIDQGISPVFLEERLNHLQMDLVREYLTQGQLDRAEEVLSELRARAPSDEGVTALQNQLQKQRAG
jgi:tetratricopeptide (TPR) repeat protein